MIMDIFRSAPLYSVMVPIFLTITVMYLTLLLYLTDLNSYYKFECRQVCSVLRMLQIKIENKIIPSSRYQKQLYIWGYKISQKNST